MIPVYKTIMPKTHSEVITVQPYDTVNNCLYYIITVFFILTL